jgi:hypothetical protein
MRYRITSTNMSGRRIKSNSYSTIPMPNPWTSPLQEGFFSELEKLVHVRLSGVSGWRASLRSELRHEPD